MPICGEYRDTALQLNMVWNRNIAIALHTYQISRVHNFDVNDPCKLLAIY